MKAFETFCLKIVRWFSWPLLALVAAFFITGYASASRFGLDRLMDPQTALTWHKFLHTPLLISVLAHSLPAVYLAFVRWGWIKR